jgi:protein gp37
MFQEFRNSLGENPVGTNAEITKALLGDNLKQVRIQLPKGLTVNEDREMCDRRGIPFFFHQLSGKEMEIRSAGADEKMWTDDDIVTK